MIRRPASKPDRMSVVLRRPGPPRGRIATGQLRCLTPKSGNKARMSMKTKDRSANSRGRVPRRSGRIPSQSPQSCLDAIPGGHLPCRIPKIGEQSENVIENKGPLWRTYKYRRPGGIALPGGEPLRSSDQCFCPRSSVPLCLRGSVFRGTKRECL